MNRSRRKTSATPSARTSSKGGAPKPLAGYRLTEALIAGWRPLQRFDVAGFAVLRSRGLTRRANSAVAIDAPGGDDALLAAVERVEGLYDMSGETACFRVMDTHGPAQLDALLAGRGYDVEGASELLERPLDGKNAAATHPSAGIRVGELDGDWFQAAWQLSPREGDDARETMRAILAATPAVQVELLSDGTDAQAAGETLAVGRAALVEAGSQSVAVLNMIRVHPEHRRRGLGRAVSETLLTVAAAQGVTRALLEVESDNTAAFALYKALGFKRLGAYHYRIRTHREPNPQP